MMRTLRTFAVAGAAALLTLANVGVVVATDAESDAEACVGVVAFNDDGMTWSATDPRLSGEATGTGGWSFYGTPAEDAGVATSEDPGYIIINDEGSWSCAKSMPDGPEPDATGHTLVFVGTGDYEGLTAHVRIDWSTYPYGFSGVIVDGGVPEDLPLEG